MSGGFDSRKDSHLRQLKRRPLKLVKLSFKELHDSKFSGLHTFDNTNIIKQLYTHAYIHVCERFSTEICQAY